MIGLNTGLAGDDRTLADPHVLDVAGMPADPDSEANMVHFEVFDGVQELVSPADHLVAGEVFASTAVPIAGVKLHVAGHQVVSVDEGHGGAVSTGDQGHDVPCGDPTSAHIAEGEDIAVWLGA
ncbi:hypothetical protein D3C80_1072910 [compost metagenome]